MREQLVCLARALHHRAGGAGCIDLCGTAGRRRVAVCQQAATAYGLARPADGHLQLGGRGGRADAAPTTGETDDASMPWPACPPTRLTDTGQPKAPKFTSTSLGKWLEVRTRYLQLGRRPAGADGDCHRHHRRAAWPKSRPPRKPNGRKTPAV